MLLIKATAIEFAVLFTDEFPITSEDVDKETFEPTFALVVNVPTLAETVLLFTVVVPTTNPRGDIFAVDEEFANVYNTLFAIEFAIELPCDTALVLIEFTLNDPKIEALFETSKLLEFANT